MATDTLSSLTGDIVLTYARTARHVVQACQTGGEKLVHQLDAQWESGVTRRAARLSPKLRNDLVAAEREISGYCARGIATLSGTAQDVLGQASRLAVAQVERLAGAAARLEPVVGAQTAQSLRVVAMPPARALSELAQSVAGQAVKLTDRVIGSVQSAAARAPASSKRVVAKSSRRSS